MTTSKSEARSASRTHSYVELSRISKSYGAKTVLDNLDLSIAEGQMLALLGPSGCGKSTSLRILAGLEAADAGKVSIAGIDVTDLPTRERGIGIVFQNYSLFPHMTAAENVAYGLKLRKMDRASRAKKAAELLELVGLDEHMAKYPKQMSGGQQQRVALARALAIQPRVLLLDEPLSALDAKVRVRLREEIRRIQLSEGITTLLVTHDQEEALTTADHVGVMLDGRIEQLGTPENLYSEPETPFIAQFVGAVNEIPAEVINGVVHTLNERFFVANREPVADGAVFALVRPEDTTVVADEQGWGRVIDRTLRGPMSSLIIEHPSSSKHVRVDVTTPTAAEFLPGTKVRLGMTRSSVVVSPRDATAHAPAPEMAPV